MPVSDFQRHSFLGGEVSPNLYERSNMEKFGQWFSKAENIRFGETGDFRNRPGFVKIADTKFNTAGQIIKLLAFKFNDEEAFLIEMGPNYIRFFKDGQPIMNGLVPYELVSPFNEFTENDLKYAQSGDTIFIAHPQYGIYELARLQTDGSAWELKKFNADILPMQEENDNTSKTATLARYAATGKYITITSPAYDDVYSNVAFVFNTSTIYTANTATLQEIIDGISDNLSAQYSASLVDKTIYIIPVNPADIVPAFSLSYDATGISPYSITGTGSGVGYTIELPYNAFHSLDNISISTGWAEDSTYFFGNSKDISSASIDSSLNKMAGFGEFHFNAGSTTFNTDGITIDGGSNKISYQLTAGGFFPFNAYSTVILSGTKLEAGTFTYNSADTPINEKYYKLTTTSAAILSQLFEGDCILIKNTIDEQELTDNKAAGNYTYGPIRSDGNWRFWTLGNWKGAVTIQYSTDNQQSWIDCFKWTSQNANDTPSNANTSGTVVSNDLVWFKVIANIDAVGASWFQFSFIAKSFTVNSYYKILKKISGTETIVECVKNDVGEISNNSKWRLPAFSNYEGWPQTVGFYQNRLFFGKDYILYGSKSNDFWDFYEPIDLKADDPVTMSLLSTEVNNIKNIVTQRSFFTFTGGGEFGIGSEGALTQSDKYMKQFSSNGSAPCRPILISDVVLFVDKSYNSVRALKYTLESDGYEAPDITIAQKSLLKSERIISTEQIFEEKEALFLSDTGTIWVLKYITDQNVMSWSHWKHAFGKITNICVVPNGAKHDLYIAVQANGKKWIEKMSASEYMDTVEYFPGNGDTDVAVTGVPGDKKVILQGDIRAYRIIDENGYIRVGDDSTKTIDRLQPFKVGSTYTSTATLLSPVVQVTEYSHSNYEVKAPFKVFFYYLNSYGFKVGVEEDEKMQIEWQATPSDVDDETDLTSGKKSVLIPSRFDGSARVSFVQEEPYPMQICDTLIQTDYGGK